MRFKLLINNVHVIKVSISGPQVKHHLGEILIVLGARFFRVECRIHQVIMVVRMARTW